MPQITKKQETSTRLYDSTGAYGWISILLHWTTTIIVMALWFIGMRILNGPTEDADDVRRLHVSIAASAWLLIFIRVAWRFRSGHPRINGQSLLIHRIAKFAHYGMLLFLLLMLLSGPLLVWSGGHVISVFGMLTIPGPIGESEALRATAWFLHSNASLLLFLLILLHIGGALKHLMFHTDDTVIRMLWPGRQDKSAAGQ